MFIDIKELVKSDDIILAKNLLYNIYIDEFNWNFPNPNPSGLKIEKNENINIIVDKFDEISNWIGVFIEKKIAACCKFCQRLNGKFELELYQNIPDFILKDPNAVEINKLVIKKEFRGKFLLLNIAKFLYTNFMNSYSTIFTTAVFPMPGLLYTQNLGFKKTDLDPFKYIKEQKDYVNLLFIPGDKNYKCNHLKKLIKI
ncbi:MAG: hypothetical protein JXB50_04675 [Spirochaetes bacterium]|nr:hypothetical protein [Spirochaetota bacterium]